MRSTLGVGINTRMWLILLSLLLVSPSFSAHAEDRNTSKPQIQKPLDPMNRPMDELA